MTDIVRRSSTFVDLMKTIFNFAIAFKKEYNEKCFAICVLDAVKEMMSSERLTRISAQ